MSEKLNVNGLSDEQLTDLHAQVSEAVELRRQAKAPRLSDIKPGMTPAERDRVRAEINKVLRDIGQ
jgi:hypothetical protein